MGSSAQFASSPIWIFAPKLTKFIHHLMSYFWLIIVREISLTNLFIFRSRDITIQNWKCWHSRFLSENEATSSDSTFLFSTAGKVIHFDEWLRQQGAILPVYSRKRTIDRTCGLLLNCKSMVRERQINRNWKLCSQSIRGIVFPYDQFLFRIHFIRKYLPYIPLHGITLPNSKQHW